MIKLLEKDRAYKKSISVYPETDKLLKNLAKKHKISQSRVIEIALKNLISEKKEA